MNKILFTGMTDVGQTRTDNEDRFHVDWCWDDNHLLAVCVDGCGGYAGGEIAAQLTVNNICAYLESHRDGKKDELLKQALIYANNIVYRGRNNESDLHRMCCVVTAALIDLQAQCINMAHVGDTRLYAVSQGRIIKLSHDHSSVGRDEEAGILTETEAMNNPNRNIIERAIGEKLLETDTNYIDTAKFPMGKGITWMFCSDGLCDMITSAEMVDVLDKQINLHEQAGLLIKAANEAGGKDNITVVLVKADDEPDEETESVMNRYASSVNPNAETDYEELMQQLFGSTEKDGEKDTVFPDGRESEGVSGKTDVVIMDELAPAQEDTAEEVTHEVHQETPEDWTAQDKEQALEEEPSQEISSEEVDEDATIMQPQAKSSKPFVWMLIFIILTPLLVLLYLHLKDMKEQEQWQRDEVIRQEIIRRELYYNINEKSYLIETDTANHKPTEI